MLNKFLKSLIFLCANKYIYEKCTSKIFIVVGEDYITCVSKCVTVFWRQFLINTSITYSE